MELEIIQSIKVKSQDLHSTAGIMQVRSRGWGRSMNKQDPLNLIDTKWLLGLSSKSKKSKEPTGGARTLPHQRRLPTLYVPSMLTSSYYKQPSNKFSLIWTHRTNTVQNQF